MAENDSLKSRILRVGAWTVGVYALESLIRLGSSLVLTRLLFPEAFGLMAIVSTVPAALAMVSEVGIRGSVIRKEDPLEPGFLYTAWTIQVVRGVLIWIVSCLVCLILAMPAVRALLPPASTLADSQLPALLAVTSATAAISGFQSINLFVMDRALDAKPMAICGMVSRFVSLPLMIWAAFVYESVWALVVGALVSQIVLTIASHRLVPGVAMRFGWVRSLALPLLHDGKWIMLSSANGLVTTLGDRFILSLLMSAQQLGWYSIALLLLESVRSLLLKLQGQLTLAVVSVLKTQESDVAAKNYYRFRLPIDVASFGAAGFFWSAGPALVHGLYGVRYAAAGEFLSIIAVGLVTLPYNLIADMFFVKRMPKHYAMLSVVGTIGFVFFVLAGHWLSGVPGMLWGLALFRVPQAIVANVLAYRNGWIRPLREIAFLPCIALGAGCGYVFAWLAASLGF